MGAYKRDAVVVIQLGAYIHRVLTIPILRYKRNAWGNFVIWPIALKLSGMCQGSSVIRLSAFIS